MSHPPDDLPPQRRVPPTESEEQGFLGQLPNRPAPLRYILPPDEVVYEIRRVRRPWWAFWRKA